MQSSFILGTFSYRTVITLGQYIFEGSEQRNLIGFLLQLQYDIWCVCVCFVLFPHSFRFKQKKKQRFFCDAFYSNSADSLHRPSHLVQKAHQRTKTEFKHELNRPIVKCIYSSYGPPHSDNARAFRSVRYPFQCCILVRLSLILTLRSTNRRHCQRHCYVLLW